MKTSRERRMPTVGNQERGREPEDEPEDRERDAREDRHLHEFRLEDRPHLRAHRRFDEATLEFPEARETRTRERETIHVILVVLPIPHGRHASLRPLTLFAPR